MKHLHKAATELSELIAELIPYAFIKNIRKLQSAINALKQKKEANKDFIVGILKMANKKTI